MRLPEETRAAMRRLAARYPEPRSALLPMLYLVQAEHRCVSDEGIAEISALLGLTRAEIMAVSTFYTMFKRRPSGEWLVSVCTNPPCALAGAGEVLRRLETETGVALGETSADGKVTVEEAECLCACDGAPVVQLNYENYERLTADAIVDIVRRLRAGETPPPGARGEAPPPWSEAHRRLSGIDAPGPTARAPVGEGT